MILYIVHCLVEGCDECGTEAHILGIFSEEETARNLVKAHDKQQNHFHHGNTSIYKCELNQYYANNYESKIY